MNEQVNILVVDDFDYNVDILTRLLSTVECYDITSATNGEEALEWVKQKNFDLILLDIMMPGMDGFEVCQQLKASEFKDIPVIFLSAKDELNDILQGFKVGGVDYITKPFRKEELMARINTHVQLKLATDLIKRNSEVYKESRDSLFNNLIRLGKEFDG